MKRLSWILLFSFFLSITGSEALAMEEVFQFYQEEAQVITASKKAEKISNAPGIISVVTRKEIDQYGAINLIDILNRVPSLQEISSHLWIQGKSVLRGDLLTHSDSHVLILINGRPFREMQEGTGDNTFYKIFPVELIERIEIVRGPGSVLYGSNAVAGVINVITQKTEESTLAPLSLKYTGGRGSFESNFQTLSADARGDDWNLTFAYNTFQDDGWNYSAWTSHPVLPALYGETEYGEKNSSLTALFDYNKRLSVQLFYASVENRALGTLPYWANEADMDSKRLFFDISYRHPISKTWDLKFNITQNNYDKGITYIQTGLKEPDKSVGILEEVSLGGEVGDKTNIIMGLINDERMSVDVVPTIPGVQRAAIPGGFYNRTFSGYVQIDHRILKNLKMIGGAQYNSIDDGDQDLVPRAGAIFDITDKVGLKLLYAKAFRGPTAQERSANLANVLQGNPDLSAEKVTTMDAQVFFNGPRVQYAFTFFNSTMEDLIIRVPFSGSTQTFTNSGEKNIWGIEFEGKWRLMEPLFLTGSATYQNERDQSLYIPNHMAKLGIAYEQNSLTGGIFISHFGQPIENKGVQLNDEPGAINLLSMNATYRFKYYLPVAINIFGTNLLDDGMAYPEFSKGWVNTLPIGPGRAVYVRLTVAY